MQVIERPDGDVMFVYRWEKCTKIQVSQINLSFLYWLIHLFILVLQLCLWEENLFFCNISLCRFFDAFHLRLCLKRDYSKYFG